MFEPKEERSLTLEQKVQILFDERDIRNVIYRYCRAATRADPDLGRTCYFDDAIDHHAPFFDMSFSQMSDMVKPGRQLLGEAIQYIAQMVLIDLDGDVARVESYIQSNKVLHQRTADGEQIVRLSGMRYLDRFERRDGEWRIAERWFVPEWGAFIAQAALTEAISIYGAGTDASNIVTESNLPPVRSAFDRTDLSYNIP